jgi:hypothetical protein
MSAAERRLVLAHEAVVEDDVRVDAEAVRTLR